MPWSGGRIARVVIPTSHGEGCGTGDEEGGMAIDVTLSILTAAVGGFLLGWQLRLDLERRSANARQSKRDPAVERPPDDDPTSRTPQRTVYHTPTVQRAIPEQVA
ncbi:MAG: hypothetical protein ABI910_14640 [Gemmatimonadota bacterium]